MGTNSNKRESKKTSKDKRDQTPEDARVVPWSLSCKGETKDQPRDGPAPGRVKFECFVEGVPAPQPRIRATKQGHIYTPPKADEWKGKVRAAAIGALGHERRGLPKPGVGFLVELDFYLPRPKSHGRPGGSKWRAVPYGRPDVDNLAKAALDALGAFQDLPRLVWDDDAQVVELIVHKAYADDGGPAGLMLNVEELDTL
jgi:Holliday junction resolvase RusA-like endonuclease